LTKTTIINRAEVLFYILVLMTKWMLMNTTVDKTLVTTIIGKGIISLYLCGMGI